MPNAVIKCSVAGTRQIESERTLGPVQFQFNHEVILRPSIGLSL